MEQVAPRRWVVKCNLCPKRGSRYHGYLPGKATFSSAKECHDWWRQHEKSEVHERLAHPRARTVAIDQALSLAIELDWIGADQFGHPLPVFTRLLTDGTPHRHRRSPLLGHDFDPENSIVWKDDEDSRPMDRIARKPLAGQMDYEEFLAQREREEREAEARQVTDRQERWEQRRGPTSLFDLPGQEDGR